MEEIIKYIVLGIVQGLTEFLPVSSSGHIVLGSELLGLSGEENLSFAIVVHAATVMSTIVILWSEIWKLFQGVFKFRWNEETQYIGKIFLSMIPVLVVGLFLKDYVKQLFENVLVVGCFLWVTAALLVFASKAKPKEKKELGWRDTFIIGLAQAVAAIFPGLSRSGSTIATGILLGNNKEKIAKFSFLMVLIPILGEAILDMKDFATVTSDTAFLSPIILLSGFLAAFITGCIACKWMISLVKRGKLMYFVIYCAIIGTISVVYSVVF
jgi:undecaprenyl-diphosphatase